MNKGQEAANDTVNRMKDIQLVVDDSFKAEYVGKLRSKIQEHLASKGLGALAVFSTSKAHIWYQTGHVSYLSGWADWDRICDSMVVVPLEGDPVMFLSGLPYMTRRAKETSWLEDIRTVAALDPSAAAAPRLTNTFGQGVRAVLSERNLTGKKIGVGQRARLQTALK